MSDKGRPDRTEKALGSDLEKLGEASLKGGLSLLAGGSFLYDLLKTQKESIRESVRKRDEERLDAFFSDLLDGESPMEPSVADALIDDRDFHALLRACIADIEAEKMDAYAALARSITCGKIDGDWKRHFILSLKDMSSKELDYLRSAYVARHFNLVPQNPLAGSMVQETNFLKVGQPGSHKNIALSNLIAKGFVHEERLSPTGIDFTKACTKENNLTPGALGYKCWSGQNVAIISYELGDNLMSNRAIEIEGFLRKYLIKTSIIAITRNNQQQARMSSTHGLLMLGQQTSNLQEHLKSLAEYASKVPLVVVQMTDQGPEVPSEVGVAKLIGYDPNFQSTLTAIANSILDFRTHSK